MTAPLLPTQANVVVGEAAAEAWVGPTGEAAVRLRCVFPPSTAARLAAAGYDVSDWWPVVDVAR